jgi:hypothetical protein
LGGGATPLFSMTDNRYNGFDVAPDGERFLTDSFALRKECTTMLLLIVTYKNLHHAVTEGPSLVPNTFLTTEANCDISIGFTQKARIPISRTSASVTRAL